MTPQDPAAVTLITGEAVSAYPPPPYSPQKFFPEYAWQEEVKASLPPVASADVYGMVRKAFFLLGLDSEHFGSASWNPLSGIITPGDTVLIKPNLVFDSNHSGHGPDCLVTHGSVVRAVADYAALAMQKKGRLLVGDAPIQACSFDSALRVSGIDNVIACLANRGIGIGVQDFRNVVTNARPSGPLSQSGGPTYSNDGRIEVAVDRMSALSPLDGHADRCRVTCYDPEVMRRYHGAGVHRYLISASVLAADVVIGVAKMKTHRKAGVTGALKNSVGIIANKDCLPHHRVGSPPECGDEYRKKNRWKRICSQMLDHSNRSAGLVEKRLFGFASRAGWAGARLLGMDPTWEGSWPGNDTLWRTVLDINRILLFAEKSGRLSEEPQRKVLFLVDGIIAGEGDGPLSPLPKPAGIIMAGFWAPAVDAVMATVMGLDWKQMPIIRHALAEEALGTRVDPNEIMVVSNRDSLCGPLTSQHKMFSFVPPRHWESISLSETAEYPMNPPLKNRVTGSRCP